MSPEQFKKVTKLHLHPIGGGSFRNVFTVGDLPLVAKFKATQTSMSDKQHTQNEMRKIKKLQRIKWMKKYLPRVYYYNPKTSLVIMEYIDDSAPRDGDSAEEQREHGVWRMLEELIRRATQVKVDDLDIHNVRFDQSTNRLKLIDLGL